MALRHPQWKMGAKITIDSAGLINKGLEVIEAHWLFDMSYEKIEVVIHPQSIIHSMVHYADGAILAQLGRADMRVPIQYAFTYPQRRANPFPALDLFALAGLTFQKPDTVRFPGLALAYAAGREGGSLPTVFNAANEVAVELFVRGQLPFHKIPVLIEKVLDAHQKTAVISLESILAVDGQARQTAAELFKNTV